MESIEIISKLLELGKITQEDIDEVSMDAENEIRRLATTLHALVCNKSHIGLDDLTAGKAGCTFYVEEQTNNPWELATHIKWLDDIKKLKAIIKRYKEDDSYLSNNINNIATIIMYAETEQKMIIDILEYVAFMKWQI